jgi:hypothetical protein
MVTNKLGLQNGESGLHGDEEDEEREDLNGMSQEKEIADQSREMQASTDSLDGKSWTTFHGPMDRVHRPQVPVYCTVQCTLPLLFSLQLPPLKIKVLKLILAP